jgi:hypothetical protein
MRMRPNHLSLNYGRLEERESCIHPLLQAKSPSQSLPEADLFQRLRIRSMLQRPNGLQLLACPYRFNLFAIRSVNLCLSRDNLTQREQNRFYPLGAYLNVCQCQPFMMCRLNRSPPRDNLHQKHKNRYQSRHKNRLHMRRNLYHNMWRQIYHQNYRLSTIRKIWLTIWRHKNRHKIQGRLSPHPCLKSSHLSGEVSEEIAPFSKSLNC